MMSGGLRRPAFSINSLFCSACSAILALLRLLTYQSTCSLKKFSNFSEIMLLSAASTLLSMVAIAHGWSFTVFSGPGCNPLSPSSTCTYSGSSKICCHGTSGQTWGSAELYGGSGWTVYAFSGPDCGNLGDAYDSWSDGDCHSSSSDRYGVYGIVPNQAAASATNDTLEWVNVKSS
ncbi:hypothetical protein BGW36DRAFT_456965 [Talaromyces proteolyticus]|uniref:Uncharacterized protein n=1 Tax=Talaromyces proteolyticus TaxID=1131652 RepID=A0AAD4L1P7_9EURO|nr:uncharacterized protein BGW36DRAFT_456965 [Talaromyces proteolyticus]KAH8705524.1 hypothetical protein BGW36DRAFT_456965 [Talaromyces proteolyticus]